MRTAFHFVFKPLDFRFCFGSFDFVFSLCFGKLGFHLRFYKRAVVYLLDDGLLLASRKLCPYPCKLGVRLSAFYGVFSLCLGKLRFHLRFNKRAVVCTLCRLLYRLGFLCTAFKFVFKSFYLEIRSRAFDVVLSLRLGKLCLHLRFYERAVVYLRILTLRPH